MQISQNKKHLRAKTSTELRQALTASQPLSAVRSFVAIVPQQSDHANHYMGPVCMLYVNFWVATKSQVRDHHDYYDFGLMFRFSAIVLIMYNVSVTI